MTWPDDESQGCGPRKNRNDRDFDGARNTEGERPHRRPLVYEQLADELLGKAQAEGAELLGPGRAVVSADQAVLERGAGRGDDRRPGPLTSTTRLGGAAVNNRNGITGKTVLTDVGAVDLAVPRDRNGTFDPQIVRKGQTRLKGVQRPDHRIVRARDDHPRRPRTCARCMTSRSLRT